MKFTDYKYERPNCEEISNKVKELTKNLVNSNTFEEANSNILEIQDVLDKFGTMSTIASIRNSINTKDEFYEKEMDYLSEAEPLIASASTEYAKALVSSKFRAELEKKYGSHWFNLLEMQAKSFDEKISDEIVEESKLTIEYSKLLASAEIEFDGKINNLSQMRVYANSSNREVRKSAYLKTAEFMASIQDKIDEIYDKLVKVRTSMAQKMGYKNFVDFGYLKLSRSDYNSKDVKKYREAVLKNVVPVAKEMFEKQRQRIGVDTLKAYDVDIFYNDGNPTPEGTTEEKVNKALKMYSELSNETKEFFSYMVENELMDLDSKPGKQGGGYCTLIGSTKSPFIFSNFNGTSGDVDVLTHEAGHAFQVYTASRLLQISDVYWPTLEACEIHSMSMEFFAYPWMKEFFNEDSCKYYFKHLSEAITFIPYGVAIDEFQHFVYENPSATPKERNLKWREIELKYTPWKDYDGVEYYEQGCFWQRQQHVFNTPFYYIDYTLAQVCAFQFYLKDVENHTDAWNTYVDLCKLGGSMPFTGLLKTVGLKNPFDDNFLEEMMPKIVNQLNKLAF